MTIEQLLQQPPQRLAERLNSALEQENIDLEAWLAKQNIDRESLLRYLEAGGYSYLPFRNRIE